MSYIIRVRYLNDERCAAEVEKRDTYRYTGRGSSGFSMHYTACQCKRKPVFSGLCRQHATIDGHDLSLVRHHAIEGKQPSVGPGITAVNDD